MTPLLLCHHPRPARTLIRMQTRDDTVLLWRWLGYRPAKAVISRESSRLVHVSERLRTTEGSALAFGGQAAAVNRLCS